MSLLYVVCVPVQPLEHTVVGVEDGLPLPEPHSAAHLAGVVLRHIDHHGVGRLRVHLSTVRVLPVQYVPKYMV